MQTVTGRTDLTYGDLIWISEFKPNVRMVNRFGTGRVFVVGGPFQLSPHLTEDFAERYIQMPRMCTAQLEAKA